MLNRSTNDSAAFYAFEMKIKKPFGDVGPYFFFECESVFATQRMKEKLNTDRRRYFIFMFGSKWKIQHHSIHNSETFFFFIRWRIEPMNSKMCNSKFISIKMRSHHKFCFLDTFTCRRTNMNIQQCTVRLGTSFNLLRFEKCNISLYIRATTTGQSICVSESFFARER